MNEETGRLVRELAGMHGVSVNDAVHEAVQSKLLQERCGKVLVFEPSLSDYVELLETDPGAAAIMAIDERRLLIARYYGMDQAISELRDYVILPCVIVPLGLLLAPFLDRPPYTLMSAITIIATIFLIWYTRHLWKENESRKQRRLDTASEIEFLRTFLPEELKFLSRVPGLNPAYDVMERSGAGLLGPAKETKPKPS